MDSNTMKNRTIYGMLLLCVVTLLGFTNTIYAGKALTISESINVENNESIFISVKYENLIVKGWNKDSVSIKGELNERTKSYTLENRGGRVVFEVKTDNSLLNFASKKANTTLEIFIPSESDLSLENVNGYNTVSSLKGPLSVSSINGGINAEDIVKRAKLDTVNGEIIAKSLKGGLVADSVNGRIKIDDINENINSSTVNGEIDIQSSNNDISANTVNGQIKIQLDTADNLKLETVNGQINLNTKLDKNADVSISTVNGQVKTKFIDLNSAKIQANTMGSIKNNINNEKPQKDKYAPNRWINLNIGEGDASIQISSVGGQIILNK